MQGPGFGRKVGAAFWGRNPGTGGRAFMTGSTLKRRQHGFAISSGNLFFKDCLKDSKMLDVNVLTALSDIPFVWHSFSGR